MHYSTLELQRKSGFGTITINRPDKLNALNSQVLADLQHALTIIREDASVHVLIITGAGEKSFVAGADISELHTQDVSGGERFAERGQAVFNQIEYLGKPVIAAINGFALGGGCELALACHLRYASEKAKFGQPEVNLGTIPGYGGTQRLTRLVGRAKSAELILTGDMISADEALRIGLVNAVLPPTELLEHCEKVAISIASKGQVAIRAALECVIQATEVPLLEGLPLEARKFGSLCSTHDFKEGTLAFLEKRKAIFKNQ